MGVNTYLRVAGRPMINVGIPVVTYADDPTVDSHPYKHFTRNRRIRGLTLRKLLGKVKQLAVHHDATLSSRACLKVLNRRGLSTHLLIDNDGTLFQAIDLAHGTWHAGKVNQTSIGLDLSNAADVRYASRYRDRGIFRGKINGGSIVALGYADPQYRTLIALIRALSRFFPRLRPMPPVDGKGQVIMRAINEPQIFEGVLAHFHISAKKWDPGPGFDWKRVFNAVHGGGFQFPLSLTSGGGGGDLTGAQFDVTAERFYQINEEYDLGGWYPVGLNGAWHSGIHLHTEKGRRVNNILNGHVVAARFAELTKLGSANFVLVRHTMKVAKEEKIFFSLAMHLDQVSFGGATKIPWLERMRANSKAKVTKSDLAGDLDLDDIDLDEEESAEDLRPGSGPGYGALLDGNVALFDPPVEIRAGEALGYVGEYGPEDDATSQIDFSILAAEPIVPLDKFPEDFEELSPDEDSNSLCDIEEVVRKLDPSYAPGSRGPISSEAIVNFYAQNPDRVEFRGYIARHISEWSPSADWRAALARRNVWAWDTRNKLKALLKKIAPYQWLTEEVAAAVGLPEDGSVLTYHPIRFLKWLARTQAGNRISVQGANAAGLTDEEIKRARAQANDSEEAGDWLQLSEDGSDISDEFEDLLDDDDGIDWKEQGPGEWPPDDDFNIFDEE